jgi:AcrR family transcriptional regulator
MSNRGRPPLQSNDTILDAALASFASRGYDATSVRSLNAQLGLSHETIGQRFGTKAELYRAAVSKGLGQFVAEFDGEAAAGDPSTDLERLRNIVRAFIIATSHHPAMGELLHQEGIRDADRKQLLASIGFDDRIAEVAALLHRLQATGAIHATTTRELWFLSQAGAAPLHFSALAAMFDPVDGPLDRVDHVERATDAIMRGMRTHAR